MGKPPVDRVGKLQRQIRRALIAADRPLLTIDLLEYGFPRLDRYRHWHYKSVYRAARKFAVNVAGPGRAIVIWAPNPELAAALADDISAEE
jgi:hypothetical protein